ncbi:MAG: hypothetical protein J2P37_04240 [Ktedonobacteraceae bacterium]|nr:hypothetical protein [Ktedonobacteraceae bacterium]
MSTDFPYERYITLAEPQAQARRAVYYPAGEEELARWVVQKIDRAAQELSRLLERPCPEMDILLVAPADWELAPHEDPEEISASQPYWTDATSPPSLVVPVEVEAIFGEVTQEKLAFFLYHELALAFLEDDPRPWPEDIPLWADEWQLKFAALWLTHTLDGQQDVVSKDLFEQYTDIFEPEPDGKTPVTVRGFDWFEDTTLEEYLVYELLLERFAAELLAHYEPATLPRFLKHYRVERDTLLSDEVTAILARSLGPGAANWLESLVYF